MIQGSYELFFCFTMWLVVVCSIGEEATPGEEATQFGDNLT